MKNIVDEREKSIRRTVLIVDDEEINREILGFMVGGEYDVIYAENGRVALEIINEKRNVLSLILLDLLMPEIDG
ncbi:MAG TPA: two-component system response regulator, partial [Clostridiales bacterium]|nr:two-component system response regulator [Clostridiales bacterium]